MYLLAISCCEEKMGSNKRRGYKLKGRNFVIEGGEMAVGKLLKLQGKFIAKIKEMDPLTQIRLRGNHLQSLADTFPPAGG